MTPKEADRLRECFRVIQERYERATDLRLQAEAANLPGVAEQADLRACALAWAIGNLRDALRDLGVDLAGGDE